MAALHSPLPGSAATHLDDYIPDGILEHERHFPDQQRPDQSKISATGGTTGLGIDEEVSVQKRVREPRVKLDESRLLSAKGIPALRHRSRVLKLKGKGHEFSDAARLLSMYQLWLDDLFPKARFGDALAMVEKEGHKSNMHKIRMEWINEARPKDTGDIGTIQEQHSQSREEAVHTVPSHSYRQQVYQTSPPTAHQQQSSSTDRRNLTVPDDEELAYLERDDLPQPQQRAKVQSADEIPNEDELDALMAEAMGIHASTENSPRQPLTNDNVPGDFDDLDALMAETEGDFCFSVATPDGLAM